MNVKIEWLGHASFRLTGHDATIYVDPFQLKGSQPAADLILITHEHYDHLSVDDINQIRGEHTVVVGPPRVAERVARCEAITLSEERTFGTTKVKATAAYNINKRRPTGELFHPPGLGCGYLVTVDGETIYHTGDTDNIPELAALNPDVALLPVSGTYVMTADEAADAAVTLGVRLAIPMHFGAFVGDVNDAERFAHMARVPVEILTPVD